MGQWQVKEEKEKNKKERVSCYGRFGLARRREEKQRTVQSERETFEQFFLDFLDKERRLRRGQSILNVVGYLDVGEADTFFFFLVWMRNSFVI